MSVLAWAKCRSACVHARGRTCTHFQALKVRVRGQTLNPESSPPWERGHSGFLSPIHPSSFPPDPQAEAMPAGSAPTCAAGGPRDPQPGPALRVLLGRVRKAAPFASGAQL